MKKERPLFPTILVLVIAMVVGFVILARFYTLSPWVMAVVFILLLAIAFFLLRFAFIFDRQMRAIRTREEKRQES